MDKKYLLKTSMKVALTARILAKVIDLFIAFLLVLFLYPIGPLLAIIYMAPCDYFHNGQSLGKRFIGLQVISLEDGSPCSIRQSVIRNLPFIVPLMLALLPLWGVPLALLVGAPLMGLELYLILKLDSGHRLGDVMADTTVTAITYDQQAANKKKRARWFGSEPYLPLF